MQINGALSVGLGALVVVIGDLVIEPVAVDLTLRMDAAATQLLQMRVEQRVALHSRYPSSDGVLPLSPFVVVASRVGVCGTSPPALCNNQCFDRSRKPPGWMPMGFRYPVVTGRSEARGWAAGP